MGECQVSVIYGTFWTRLLQANHTQVHDSYCSMSCMYVLTLAMLVEGSHRILDSRNMVLITGKAFTILGLVVKWSDLRIQRCTAMNAGSATGSHGARYIRVQNSDIYCSLIAHRTVASTASKEFFLHSKELLQKQH